jgi:hypothetical protein
VSKTEKHNELKRTASINDRASRPCTGIGDLECAGKTRRVGKPKEEALDESKE